MLLFPSVINYTCPVCGSFFQRPPSHKGKYCSKPCYSKAQIRWERPCRDVPEHKIWQAMLRRCYNPKDSSFFRYGQRGIVVCDRWKNSFDDFLADMSTRPKNYTLERKNNDGPYSPENCVWASYKDQANNRRRNTSVTIGQDTKTI